jgi:hypothetical protein
MNTNVEHIFLIFIILILSIGIGYWFNTTSKEGFDNTEAITTISPQTTSPQTTSPLETIPQTTNSNPLSEAISNQLSNISDSTMRDTLQTQLTNLQSLVDRYSTLDIPIVMNDAGQICSMWNDYEGGRYRQQQNQCLALDDTNILKCLDTSGLSTTCNNILSDGYITNKSNINNQPLLSSAASTAVNALPGITNQIAKMEQTANTIITSLSDRGSIQLQQKDIITNNNENMAYKNKIMEDNIEKLNKKQNDTNINQNNFSSFMSYISDADSISNLYYKITLGLVITIIIIGILNFLFSNILS